MLEYFGDIRTDKLNTSVIRQYMAYLKTEKGLSAKTINKHRTHVERKSTKNKEIRTVGIPDWLYDCLERVKHRQEEMRGLLQGEYHTGREFVFCHDNGKPWNPNSLSNEYKVFLEKNGFKHIRYHDLRHTNLSMLMTKMSAVDVAKLGGHKQVSTTTDIYGHSFDDSVERGAETMNEIMDGVLHKY